ncbi:MAG: M15 family metallopeptidase [Bacillota bacterium]|jgi:LAS superfamily LD-carboxypeptidase LdcB
MSEMPRSRPRGRKKAVKQKKTSSAGQISGMQNRNQISEESFYGGAASGRNNGYVSAASHGTVKSSGSSSYKNWKKNQKRRKSNLRNKRASSRRNSKRFLWGKFTASLAVILVIVFLASFAFSANFRTTIVSGIYAYVYNHTHDDPQLADTESNNGEAAAEGAAIIYTTVDMEKEDVNRGNLILVNGDNEYNFDANADLIDLVSMNQEHSSSFSIYQELEVGSVMMNALNNMFDDFYNATGNNSVRVISAYRSYEYQSSLYDSKVEEVGQEMADTWAAKPGYSEHHTGLAVDIGIADGDGASTFTTEGSYAWVAENCHKYGLVNRYDESKQELTGIMDEPWHYRYVGVPHSYVMYNKNLCLEEYIENLKYYSYKGEHLKVAVDSGTEYEIYYVNSSFRNGVPVPKNYEYEISGNNADGFIVTVNMSKPK